jgi:hypothetical protein
MTNFFKSDADRNLWIKLKGEFINEFQIQVNKSPSDIEGCEQVARNQLEFDEREGKLRITLEQLLSFSYEQYEEHLNIKHKEWCEVFVKLENEIILRRHGWNPDFSGN